MRSSYSVTSSYLPTRHEQIGQLHELDASGNICKQIAIYADEHILIGRDTNQCHYLIWDPCVSNKHLRIHTVLCDRDDGTGCEALVFAEDLSRNGTFLNGLLMGRGAGGFLLSNGDTMRISSRFHFQFVSCPGYEQNVDIPSDQEEEIRHFQDQFLVTRRQLGAGAFGRVLMASDTSTDHVQYACKIIDLTRFKPKVSARFGKWQKSGKPASAHEVDDDAQIQKVRSLGAKKKEEDRLKSLRAQSQREAEILKDLNHPNIIGFEKVFLTDDTIYLFQELVTGGDLFSHLESKGGTLAEVDATVITYQVVMGLNYLHQNNIVHRDLKPENILLTSKSAGCRIVLTDFGCARKIEHSKARMATFTGTENYAAPELLKLKDRTNGTADYSKAIDLWSLGCITATILIGASPFSDTASHRFSEQLARECNMEYLNLCVLWQRLSPRPRDFVQKLLQQDPSKRLTAVEAMRHDWFTTESYGPELQEQYKRSIRHWRPRRTRLPVYETFNGGCLLEPSPLSGGEFMSSKKKRKSPMPIDPPYKPYARKMHRPLLPRRSPNPMTPEARLAIDTYWSEETEEARRTTYQAPKSTSRTKSFKRRAHSPMAWGPESFASNKTAGTAIAPHSPSTPITISESRTLPMLEAFHIADDATDNHEVLLADKTTNGTESGIMVRIEPDTANGSLKPRSRPVQRDCKSVLVDRDINRPVKVKSAAHVVTRLRGIYIGPKRRRTGSVFDLE